MTLNFIIQSLLAFGAMTAIPFVIFYNHNIGPIRITCLCVGVLAFVSGMIVDILSTGQFNIITQTFHVNWLLATSDLAAKSVLLISLWVFAATEWRKGPYIEYKSDLYERRSKKEGDEYRTRAEQEGDKYRRRAEEEGDQYRNRAERESDEKKE